MKDPKSSLIKSQVSTSYCKTFNLSSPSVYHFVSAIIKRVTLYEKRLARPN